MKIYAGGPGQPVLVYVDAEPARVLDSEQSFAWGDFKSEPDPIKRTEIIKGSIQLALAILTDYLGDEAKARKHHQLFKTNIGIEKWAKDQNWSISNEEINPLIEQFKEIDAEIPKIRRIVDQTPPPSVAEGGGGVKWTKMDMPQPNRRSQHGDGN